MLLFYRDAGFLYVFPGLPMAAALAVLASHFINKSWLGIEPHSYIARRGKLSRPCDRGCSNDQLGSC